MNGFVGDARTDVRGRRSEALAGQKVSYSHESMNIGLYRLIGNISVVIRYRPGCTVGAIGDRNLTGYADLSDGSDLSTNRVIASRHQQTGDPS